MPDGLNPDSDHLNRSLVYDRSKNILKNNNHISNNITSATSKMFLEKERILGVSQMLIQEKSLRHLRKKNLFKHASTKNAASLQSDNDYKIKINRKRS